VLDEQTVSNDSNSDLLFRQLPKHLRRSGHWLQHSKQLALRYGELVELRIATGSGVQSPLGKTPRHFGGQLRDVPTEPLSGNRTQTTVEVCARPVQVDAENERLIRHRSLRSSGPPRCVREGGRARFRLFFTPATMGTTMTATRPQRPVFALEQKLGVTWPNLHACEEATDEAVEKLRAVVGRLSTEDTSVVLYGSLARREFTADSDADWSLLVDGVADPQHLDSSLEIGKRIAEIPIKQPGREGTFGQLTFSHDLIHYIGGEDDTNANTTRRMLLLLESVPVGGADAYDRVLRNVLGRYLSEDYGWIHGRNPRGVPRFLQNDIARYWRTMAVDFAYKQRQRGGEGWALRSTNTSPFKEADFRVGLTYVLQLRA
jgi:predicted nucleotidyltransferase